MMKGEIKMKWRQSRGKKIKVRVSYELTVFDKKNPFYRSEIESLSNRKNKDKFSY